MVSGGKGTEVDTRRLLQELQVHQVELEMQNAELQTARNTVENALKKFTDLYDFAPVGYFAVDRTGLILESNLTGAALLGMERSRLGERRLQDFIVPESRPDFAACLEGSFTGRGKRVCEVLFRRTDGTSFWVDLQAARADSVHGRKRCRLAISDITALKSAEEAQHRVEALAAANAELQREITRRQIVEEALHRSEQHQTLLLEQSRHTQQRLRHLSHHILRAQEEERKRISRELHDEIAQILVGIHVQLEILAREASVNPARLRQQIARTQRLVEKSVNAVHQFARELRPTALDDLGLSAALRSLIREFMMRTGVRVRFTTFAKVERLSSSKRIVLYRVVHSALANVAEHAQAGRVSVSVRKVESAVHLEIIDDGKSFDVTRVLHGRRNEHLGLLGMRERVEMIGGRFDVESAPGKGTAVRARIPFGKGMGRAKGLRAPR